MASESDHPRPGDPRQVIARDDGWFVVGPDGAEIAGPFRTLDDVEDYLDSQEAHPTEPPLASAAAPPDHVPPRANRARFS
jgi:hypothetical protein